VKTMFVPSVSRHNIIHVCMYLHFRLVVVVMQSDLIIYLVLGGLFFYTLYAGYLGWQWRRVRTIQNDINELKK
jgi:hypothetical protein